MSTITRERLLKIQQWRETYGPGSNVVLPAEEAEELAHIALTSLEAEPVAYIIQDKADRKEGNRGQLSFKSVEQYHEKDINEHELTATPLYTAPPAPASSSLISELLAIAKKAAEDADECAHAEWNDDSMEHSAAISDWERRAAMLHGDDGNSPVVPDGLNIRAVAALREAVRNQWLKSDEFAEKIYWKNMHDIANEIVVAMLAAAPQQEVK